MEKLGWCSAKNVLVPLCVLFSNLGPGVICGLSFVSCRLLWKTFSPCSLITPPPPQLIKILTPQISISIWTTRVTVDRSPLLLLWTVIAKFKLNCTTFEEIRNSFPMVTLQTENRTFTIKGIPFTLH